MLVLIKELETGSEEAKIAMMLSAQDIHAEPENHCIPVIDHFEDPVNTTTSYLVMPYLRPSHIDPDFLYVEEMVDFVNQVLEVSIVHAPFYR
jgi:hypothetical protein